MADYCQACSIKVHGRDHRDLARLCKPGETVWELCEGCGDVVELDSEGRKITESTQGTPMSQTKSLFSCQKCNNYFHDVVQKSCPNCGSPKTERVSFTKKNRWSENGLYTNLIVFGVVGGFFALLGLGAWGAYSWVSSQSVSNPGEIEKAKIQIIGRENVKSIMKDPRSAEFRNEFIGSSGAPCGEVNAKNGYGAFTGFNRFIASGGGLAVVEGTVPANEFNESWDQLCRK